MIYRPFSTIRESNLTKYLYYINLSAYLALYVSVNLAVYLAVYLANHAFSSKVDTSNSFRTDEYRFGQSRQHVNI